jgi:hypothetical protein
VLCTFLLLSIIFVVLDIPHGYDATSLRTLMGPIYRSVFVPTISFFAEIIKSLFPWPFIALIVIALIAWGPAAVREILSALKMEFGGFKLEGGGKVPDMLKKDLSDAHKVVERANAAIAEAYSSAKAYAAELRDKHEIPVLVSEVAIQVAHLIGSRCPEDYRMTLHIPDLVFYDRLFQFTEYYNKAGKRSSENRAGRTLSIRYGIIGRVWRSGVPEIEGDLITSADRNQLGPNPSPQEMERFIARRWGLLLEEVGKVRPYNSYAAFRLEKAQKWLGVLYFDSKKPNAFAEPDQLKALQGQVESALSDSGLLEKLLEVNRDVAPWSGRIQVFRSD